jgi:NAD(P)-dependent dehydrogenase (short-subunit alcohol dehydrogenase family)
MIDLTGKVAIVTGAAGGLGAEMARGLHRAGASVVIADIERAAGAALARELGSRALFQATDITDDAAIDACIVAAREAFGGLDILVNDACTFADRGLQSTRAEWLHTLNVNLVSAGIFTQKAAPELRRGGVVVFLGSVGGKTGAAGRALYPVSKAALLQLTKNVAVDLAPRGVRAVAISPAWTWSPALERMAGTIEKADRAGAHTHALGRIGRAAEIANAVVFVCSDAASWITGVDIPVDGGFSVLGPDQGRGPRPFIEAISEG